MLCLLLILTVLVIFSPEAYAEAEIPDEWKETIENGTMTEEEFRSMSFSEWLKKLKHLLSGTIRNSLRLFAKVCAVIFTAAVFRSIADNGTSPDFFNLLDSASLLAASAMCIPSLLQLAERVKTLIENSRIYIVSFVPVFTSVLTACGQKGLAAVYGGFFFGVSMAVSEIICRILVPVTRGLLALSISSSFGGLPELAHLGKSAAKAVKWVLSFSATVFCACLGMQSIFAQHADSLALKTGKFLIGSSVPVIGRALSDAAGSVLTGMKVLKGGVGFAAVSVLAASFLPVLIETAILHAAMFCMASIADALGVGRNSDMLFTLSECIGLFRSILSFYLLIVCSATIVMIWIGSGAG